MRPWHFATAGDLEDAMKWTQEFTSFGKPIVNTVTTIEYRLWQRSLDARWGNGFFNDWRGHYLDDLSSDAIRVLMDHVEGLDSPWTDIKIVHLEFDTRPGKLSTVRISKRSIQESFRFSIQCWPEALRKHEEALWLAACFAFSLKRKLVKLTACCRLGFVNAWESLLP